MQQQSVEPQRPGQRRPKGTPGIEVRHARACRSHHGSPCSCRPSYRAEVWSKRDGRKVRKSFPTLAAAKGWRIDKRKAVRDKQLRATSPRTLAEEAAEWLAGASEGRILNKRRKPYKRAAIANYERSLRLYVLPELGNRQVADIELADLLDLKEQLHGRGCGDSTVRNAFTPIQALFRRARQKGLVAIDPTSDLELPTPGRRDRAASLPDALALLKPLNALEAGVYATAFFAGLRRGEMRALRVRDVDLAKMTITVERGWDDEDGPIAPKSEASARTVFLLDVLRPYLEPLAIGRDADALLYGYGDATPFEPRAVGRKAERLWKAVDKGRAEDELAPLARYTFHEGRHSFASWAIDAGIPEASVSRYLGHSTGNITRSYTHAVEGQLEADRKRLDEYITGRIEGKIVPITAMRAVG